MKARCPNCYSTDTAPTAGNGVGNTMDCLTCYSDFTPLCEPHYEQERESFVGSRAWFGLWMLVYSAFAVAFLWRAYTDLSFTRVQLIFSGLVGGMCYAAAWTELGNFVRGKRV